MRIFVVDDHPVFRHGLIELLKQQKGWEVIGEAASAEEALRQIKAFNPDLLIADISLEGMNGIELTKRINLWESSMKVLILSVHDETVFAERALQAGASGYVTKQTSTEELVEAIRTVIRGGIYLDESVLQRVLARAAGRSKTDSTRVASLTDRELEVFELLGRGLTTKQIADQLNLSAKTIETYREKIKRKLGLKSSLDLVRQALLWCLEEF